MNGHYHINELVAAEHRHQLLSDAELYRASKALEAKRSRRQTEYRPSLVLRLVRHLAHARSVAREGTATTVAAGAAAPTA